MRAARIDAEIERRFAALGALTQRVGQVQLQRVVMQRMLLRLGDAGGEVEVIPQRVIGRQLTQAFSAAGVQAFQIREQ